MKSLFLLLVGCFISSCIRTVDIQGPAYIRRPVLLGILHPDSTLSVRLTWSKQPTDNTPAQPISDANVLFYENGQPIGQALLVGSGKYAVSKKPMVNRTYRVSVNIPNLPTLTAEDYLPAWHDATLTITKKNPDNTNQNPDIIYRAKKTLSDSAFLWAGLYATYYFSLGYPPGCIVAGQVKPGCELSFKKLIGDNYISTHNLIFDQFNGYFDALSNRFSNNSPARVRTELFNTDPTHTITFAPFNQGESWTPPTHRDEYNKLIGENILEITFAGPAYDRYLKSAITAYRNRLTDFDGNLFSPFAEPSPVYSNVTNGLGIFGARNGRYILLKLDTNYHLAP